MEAQLRARLESLISISKHPIRSIEQKTFRRLLYRNRNQHRHGLYFRKLEHVRRLLSQIDRHIAWESLQYSLGDSGDEGPRAKSNRPLSLSSLTVDDLKSVENLFDKLVNTAIIEAARRVVTDLISREHFMPFAVSIIATLARLFVLERKLLSEVRGVKVEMGLLFAADGPTEASQQLVERDAPVANEEDIGLVVSARTDKQPRAEQGVHVSKVACDPVNGSRDTDTAEKRENELRPSMRNIPSASAGSETLQPSLYHLLAKHSGAPKFSAEVQERTSVSLPEVLGAPQGREERSPKLHVDNSTGTHEVIAPDASQVMAPALMEITGECTADRDPDADTHRHHSPERENSKLTRKPSTDASDSDDIDDIFDTLEDS